MTNEDLAPATVRQMAMQRDDVRNAYRGRRGAVALAFALVLWTSANWIAWVGAPTSEDDGAPALQRSKGVPIQRTTAAVWYASVVAGVICLMSMVGWVASATYCLVTASKNTVGRNFAKTILAVWIGGLALSILGMVFG